MRPLWSSSKAGCPLSLLAQVSPWDRRETIAMAADLATFLAYAVIPPLIGYYLLRRRRVHFSWVWILLVAYLIAGGAVNILSAFGETTATWTAALKIALAFISWLWVRVLIPLLPRLIEARTAEEFAHLLTKHEQAEAALRE